MIAAIDNKNGLADEHGIPWQRKIPTDVQYFRKLTEGSSVLMGAVTYSEFALPLPDRRNFVLTHDTALREGFEPVQDLDSFISSFPEDLWIIGGAGVFAQSMDYTQELYLTRIEADFNCTKFFPPFEDKFSLSDQTEDHLENGLTFRFEIWIRV